MHMQHALIKPDKALKNEKRRRKGGEGKDGRRPPGYLSQAGIHSIAWKLNLSPRNGKERCSLHSENHTEEHGKTASINSTQRQT